MNDVVPFPYWNDADIPVPRHGAYIVQTITIFGDLHITIDFWTKGGWTPTLRVVAWMMLPPINRKYLKDNTFAVTKGLP